MGLFLIIVAGVVVGGVALAFLPYILAAAMVLGGAALALAVYAFAALELTQHLGMADASLSERLLAPVGWAFMVWMGWLALYAVGEIIKHNFGGARAGKGRSKSHEIAQATPKAGGFT